MTQRVTPLVPALNTGEYFSTKKQVTAIRDNVIIGDVCCFLYPNCEWTLPAVADLTDTADYKNDKKDFIIRIATNSTVVGTLIKIDPDGTETPTTITDSTYGQFFALGDLATNVWGFILDWRLVASGLGFGKYKFNITVENSTSTETLNKDSVCWQLIPYSCGNTHRTIRIETKQSGYFEGGFDYSDLAFSVIGAPGSSRNFPWPQQIRLWGRFHREGRDLTMDVLVTKERGQEQVQSLVVKRYLLQLDTIQTNISNHLIDDMLQAPDVRISDYNTNNIEVYQSTRVSLTDLNDPIITEENRSEFYDINFVEWKQDNLHRYR